MFSAIIRLGSLRTRGHVQFHSHLSDGGSAAGNIRISSELIIQDFVDKQSVLCLPIPSRESSSYAIIPQQMDPNEMTDASYDVQFLKLLHYALAKEGRAAVVAATIFHDDESQRTEFRVGVIKAKSRQLMEGTQNLTVSVLQLQLMSDASLLPDWPPSSKNNGSTKPSYALLDAPLKLLPFLSDQQVLDLTREFIEATVSNNGAGNMLADGSRTATTLASIIGYLEISVAEKEELSVTLSTVSVDQLKRVLAQCQQLLEAMKGT